MTPPIMKKLTHIVYLQVPTRQLAKLSIGPKFVELTLLTSLKYFYKKNCLYEYKYRVKNAMA